MSHAQPGIGVVAPDAADLRLTLEDEEVLVRPLERVGRGQPTEAGPDDDDAEMRRSNSAGHVGLLLET